MTKGKQVVLPSYLISETQGQQSSNGKSQALTFDQWPSVPGTLAALPVLGCTAVVAAEPPPSRVHRGAVSTPLGEKLVS